MKRANVKYTATTAVNGFYSSGCGLDVDKTIEEKTLEEETNKVQKKGQRPCLSKCGGYDHYNKSSYLCPFNKINMQNMDIANGKVQNIAPCKIPKGKKKKKSEEVTKELKDLLHHKIITNEPVATAVTSS